MELAAVGSLLADPTRARLLTLLLDDRARTVTELANTVGVAPSTASEHLRALREAGLVSAVAQGRHRYHHLAGPEVAHLLETVMVLGAERPPEPRTPADLRFARTCYDHLAGALGVAVHERIAERAEVLAAVGVDLPGSAAHRPVFRACLDWSERRPHLAGVAGAALLATLLERRWLVPRPTPRALRLTETGRRGLTEAWGAVPCWSG